MGFVLTLSKDIVAIQCAIAELPRHEQNAINDGVNLIMSIAEAHGDNGYLVALLAAAQLKSNAEDEQKRQRLQ